MADGAGHGHELIIIKRHEEEEHAHHSSAWKVAHADFMTAMMAFFLIMWLINVTDDEVRKGISQYFNPIHMSVGSSELKGLNKTDEEIGGKPSRKGPTADTAPAEAAPIEMTAAAGGDEHQPPLEATQSPAGAAGEPRPSPADPQAAPAGQTAARAPTGAGAATSPATGAGAIIAGAELAGDAKERAAFQDPFSVLAKLAAEYAATRPANPAIVEADTRPIGVQGGELDRDPFDPTYWQLSPLPPQRADSPGEPGSIAANPDGRRPDAGAAETRPPGDARAASNGAVPGEPATTSPPLAATEAPAATPTDLSIAAAAAAAAGRAPVAPDVVVENASGEVTAETMRAAEAIAGDLAATVQTLLAGKAPEVSVKATAEGTLIGLTDDTAFSMFPIGSAIPDPKVVALLEKIAETLADRPGDVVIRGHTDGRPFHSVDYDNWRLSTARAHMAYYMLSRGGLSEDRVVAIEGHADRELLNPADPNAAENRRIEILIKAGSE
jgi:chemotaxis protein MotB